MKLISKITCLFISALFFISLNSFSQNWVQWRGPERNSVITDFDAPQSWPSQLSEGWSKEVGDGYSSPVIWNNKLYAFSRVGNEEVITCLDANSGETIWDYKYGSPAVTGPAASFPGPRSTPAISDGKIVTLGVAGILTCLDAQSGQLIWQIDDYSQVPTFFTSTSPLLLNGVCYIHLGGEGTGHYLAIELSTGNLLWDMEGEGPCYASPSLIDFNGQKLIVASTEKSLIGIDLSGNLLWKYETPLAQRFYNSSSPVIAGQTIYLTGQGTGSKALKIEKQGDNYIVNELWAKNEAGTKWNTPVLKNGYLFGLSDGRKLYCINATTGETAWINDEMLSDYGTILDAGNELIVSSENGELIVYKPDPGAYSETARYQITEGKIYSFPAFIGNRIYVRDKMNVAMFEIE